MMSLSLDPLVSIIIPCFNAERYVGASIKSALEQTYTHREIIVVDDGSTDGSLKVLKGFGDAIQLVTGVNQGGAAARNRGTALAKGELIQYLDADDLLHPEKLARQVPLAVRNRNAAVYCNYGLIDKEGRPIPSNGHVAPISSNQDPVVFVLLNPGISTPGPLLWRDDLVEIGGFREELQCAQERDLHIRLACKGIEFQHFPKELISVRQLPSGVSSDYMRVLNQHSDIVREACDVLEKKGELTDERLEAMAGLLATDARCYIRHGEKDRATKYFGFAKKLHAGGGIKQAYPGLQSYLFWLLGPTWLHRLAVWRRKLI